MPKLFSNITLDFMAREMSRMWHEGARSPEVQTLANTIAASHPDNKLMGIFDWMRANFVYKPDPADAELLIHPWLQAYVGTGAIVGDCDDAGVMNASLLEALGYEARILIVDSDSDGEYDHALAEVKAQGQWLSFDTLFDNAIGASMYRNPMVVT